MSPLPTTRALRTAALTGVACLSLLLLPNCGGEEGGMGSFRGELPPGTGAMPEDWPALTQDLLPELRKNPFCAEAIAGVQENNPQALWQYWKSLVGELRTAGVLPHINHYGISSTYSLPAGDAGAALTKKAAIYLAFRGKLEAAIIQQAKLSPQQAEIVRRDYFPNIWNAYISQ